jgi:starch synthase
MGSRLTHQKMADVAVLAMEAALRRHDHVQFAVLGCGDPALEAAYRALGARHPDRVGISIGYREEDAHLLHAGADALLHGSRFEPFGLTPVYAMRYGTVPIVSRVGGMADTVRDVGEDALPAPRATGIVFDGDSVETMGAAITRALDWFHRPRHWRAMQRAGMQTEFGWEGPAQQYLAMYRALAPALAHVPAAVPAPLPDAVAAPAARPSRAPRPALPTPAVEPVTPGLPA